MEILIWYKTNTHYVIEWYCYIKMIWKKYPGGDNKHELILPLLFFWWFSLNFVLKINMKLFIERNLTCGKNQSWKIVTDDEWLKNNYQRCNMAWKHNISKIQTLAGVVFAVFCCGDVSDKVEFHIARIRIRTIQWYNRIQVMVNPNKSTEATLIVKLELMNIMHLPSAVFVDSIHFFAVSAMADIVWLKTVPINF